MGPLPAEVTRLQDSAKRHKRAIRHHRRLLQEDSQKLEQLREDCARYGIAVIVEPTPSVEEKTHGSIRPQN